MSTRSSSARAAETTSAMMRQEAGDPEVEEIEADEFKPSRLLFRTSTNCRVLETNATNRRWPCCLPNLLMENEA